MSIIIFLIILAVLVLVHEFGHFIVAKKSGIRVDEFGLGFPPTLWSIKKGETKYSLNLIPFGGFVKIHGENPDEDSISGPDSGRSFVNKNRAIQAFVLAAGILFNIIFAWLLISISFMSGVTASSADYSKYDGRMNGSQVVITSVSENSPAFEAGLKPGELIVKVEGAGKILEAESLTISNIQSVINVSTSTPIVLTYKKGDSIASSTLTPKAGIIEGRQAIGIGMDNVATLRLPPHLALYEGAKFTTRATGAVASGLYGFITDAFRGDADFSSVSGPVGIVGLVGDATKLGVTYVLMFTALISINLAIINLVPFPALDGGRILFVLIESITRKKIKPQVANTLNAIGFSLLILLMLFVTYKDIMKLF
jgi:regulator of sigma E protease